jgi:hypothetical protein
MSMSMVSDGVYELRSLTGLWFIPIWYMRVESHDGMILTGENRISRENSVPVQLYSSQVPHGHTAVCACLLVSGHSHQFIVNVSFLYFEIIEPSMSYASDYSGCFPDIPGGIFRTARCMNTGRDQWWPTKNLPVAYLFIYLFVVYFAVLFR